MRRGDCFISSPLQKGSELSLTGWGVGLEQRDAWPGGALASKRPEKITTGKRTNQTNEV